MLLASDLDGTFLGGKSVDKLKLYRLIRNQRDIRLAFVTGRGVESVLPLLNDPLIPHPDYIISDVGATLVQGRSLETVEPVQSLIEKKWPGKLLFRRKLARVKGLTYQEVPQQRRCSFYYEDESVLEEVQKVASEYDCDVLLSAGKYLDILPGGVNKGSTLKQLVKMMDIPESEVLVAGDTLNDLSLFDSGFKGVVVGGSEKALIEATSGNPRILQAKQAGAGGILEALQHFPEFRQYYQEADRTPLRKQEGETQLLMVYHRLPYEKKEVGGKLVKRPPQSPNGILPSLLGLFETGRSGAWIAWEESARGQSPQGGSDFIDEERFPNLLVSSVPLPKKDIEIFYKIFSKEAFWPVIFSFIERARFNHDHWETYLRINRLFAERVAREADQGALVWIHEYNLWMVPAFLRPLRPDVKIGFFHHTSFPPADIFNVIPWRREIIGSLLQCDFLSFHIPRYTENFVDVVKSHAPVKVHSRVNAAGQFLTYSCALGIDKMTKEIEVGGRRIRLGAQPVGVNVENIKRIYEQESTQENIEKLRQRTKGKRIILSIERLDYVKGPLEKIRAFGEFLEEYPEFHGKIELINICTPPSQGMKIYEKVQTELDQAVGKINGRYSSLEWTPIRYFFRSVPFEEVLCYYAIADVAWITPLRDGLNLVAKEYVAVQGQKEKPGGALVLSEFAGASVELPYAILTNPYDKKDLKETLLYALGMDENEKAIRMKRLYETVSYYDVQRWGREFMEELEQAGQ